MHVYNQTSVTETIPEANVHWNVVSSEQTGMGGTRWCKVSIVQMENVSHLFILCMLLYGWCIFQL